ncbi:MAG: hypothetical protein ACR2FQ_02725 [Pseudonocardiaceae bacterium]
MTEPSSAPRAVRAAGALVALQGAVGAAICLGVVVRVFTGAADVTTMLGTAVWFALVAAATIGIGVTLWRGAHGARTPAVVAQLLLLGVAWYAAGPSSRPEYGVPGAAYCAIVLGLLFCPPAVRWAYDIDRFSD